MVVRVVEERPRGDGDALAPGGEPGRGPVGRGVEQVRQPLGLELVVLGAQPAAVGRRAERRWP